MSPGAVSRIIAADKTALARRMLDGIRSLPLADLAAFTADPRMVAAADSYLRRALEAVLDLGRHILSKGFGRAPAEYAEVARQLGDVGVMDSTLAGRLERMARYRNRMVHFYDEITDQELFTIVTTHLGDVDAVLSAIAAWMVAHPDRVSQTE